MTREARSIRCPEGVLGWIPWYGENGGDGNSVLTERQRGAVEAHCAECSDCRAELDMISGNPFEIDVDLPDPERLFSEITARIETSDVESGNAVIPIGRGRTLEDADYEKLANWIFDESVESELEASLAGSVGSENTTGNTNTNTNTKTNENLIRAEGLFGGQQSWAAAAAAILLLGVGVAAGTLFSQNSSTGSSAVYSLAAADAGGISETPGVDVVFHDDASAAQIFDSLRGLDLKIVSGPSSGGVYRLRPQVQADRASGEGVPFDAASIAKQLRTAAQPVVQFAEPVP